MTQEVDARRSLLAEVAQRYYVDGWSQDKVAEHVGTSRSNVSRLLGAAHREGVLRFVVDRPQRRHARLERLLCDRFELDFVRVTADNGLGPVGQAAAVWLGDNVPEGGRIAIGWGNTVEAMIDALDFTGSHDVEVVQVGGDLTVAPAATGHELVRRLADAVGGSYRFLHAPAVVASEALATSLRADERIAAELDRAAGADVAIVGIGSGAVEGVDGAVSVVSARLLDAGGREIVTPGRGVVALEMEELAAIPTVVGVAGGAAKGPALRAAMLSGAFDGLVCDRAAAKAAMEEE